jgi:hypothetical protein
LSINAAIEFICLDVINYFGAAQRLATPATEWDDSYVWTGHRRVRWRHCMEQAHGIHMNDEY